MQAIILCAGLGTRMGELTKSIPKPLLPLNETTLLGFQFRQLKKAGVTDIYINLHYLGNLIEEKFKNGKELGLNISYITEKKLSGTAGGVKVFESALKDQDLLILYGDVITDENFSRLINFHQSNNALISLYVHKNENSNSLFVKENDGKIVDFVERPDAQMKSKFLEKNNGKEFWVNSGIYLVKKSVLQKIPADTFCDFPKDVFPSFVNHGLYALEIEGKRVAVDSPQRLEEANRIFKS